MDSPAAGVSGRLTAIDALRGVVMVIMALDHVREFFHADAMVFRAEDLARTNTALFLTRWITHFCAPVFFFLAGVGACLWASRPGRTPAALTRYLFTRGLWLIVLELTVFRFALTFSLTTGPVLLTALWALGASMMILSLTSRLPMRVLAALSLATIALHNAFDPISAGMLGPFGGIWTFLHRPGVVMIAEVPVVAGYPLIPWAAVMSAGFCFGRIVLDASPDRRRKLMRRIGWACVVGFLVLRGANLYGDPVPWSSAIPGTSVLSFLNVTKYPPSLLFLLMTLGPALLGWAWLLRHRPPPTHPVVVIGRAPLAFFVAHFYIAHLLAFPFALVTYGRAGFLLQPMPSVGGAAALYPEGFGYSLPTVYAVWALVVALTYPVCVWIARLKERRRDWWLSYL